MQYTGTLVVSTLLLTSMLTCWGYDLPCVARPGDLGRGYICVCNSTYCDTVERPEVLESPLYHHYHTSNSSPGFTHTIGAFHTTGDPNDDDVVFTVDSSVEFQEILGFGGSLTDTVGWLLNSLPQPVHDNLINAYFSPIGIEYNFLRLPIGSTDFSEREYTLDDVPMDVDLQHFKLAEEDYNYRIAIIKQAQSVSLRDIKNLACSWAAPAWMKAGQTKFSGYIADEHLGVWAQYQIKYIKAMKENGIDIWSISPSNEPVLLYLLPLRPGTLNSTLDSAPAQKFWISEHLRPALQRSGLGHVKVLALEDQRFFAYSFMKTFVYDQKAYDAVDGVGVHWYSDFLIDPKALDDIHDSCPDKLMMMTEASINGAFGPEAVVLGSWYRSEGYIYNIMENLSHWMSSYIDWNIVLNQDGGPSTSFGIEAPVIINQTSNEFYKQPIFYAIGHFSKFIQPGARRINVTSNQPTSVRTAGSDSMSPEEIMLKLTMQRRGKNIREPEIAPFVGMVSIPAVVQPLATKNPDGSVTIIVMNSKNVTANVKIVDPGVGTISLQAEEHSINTFVYWPDKPEGEKDNAR